MTSLAGRLDRLTQDGAGAATRGRLAGARHRRPRRQGVRVLSFHGVVDRRADERLHRYFHTVDEVRSITAHLRRHATVLPPACLLDAGSPPVDRWRRPPVVLTVDDGYANNLVLADLFAEAGLPWAVFTSTGAVGSTGSIWTVELALLLLHGEPSAADRSVELLGERWSLADRPARVAAHQAIRRPLKAVPAAERRAASAALAAQFPDAEVVRLVAEHPELAMLTWDQVRQLQRAGVVVGGHGVDHEIQGPAQPAAVVADEAAGSAAALTEELGQAPELFAYPDGQWNDASGAAVAAAGYRAALTTADGTVGPGPVADPFALPRIEAPGVACNLARALAWVP